MPHVISLMQDKLDDEAMGHECRDKVIADVERSSTDYRCLLWCPCGPHIRRVCSSPAESVQPSHVTCWMHMKHCCTPIACLLKTAIMITLVTVIHTRTQCQCTCRLNFRLRDACEEDLSELCPNLCKEATKHACGGRALRCLTDNAEQIRNKGCRDEVFYFEKMEVRRF